LAERGVTAKTLVSHIQALPAQTLARQPEPASRDPLIRFQGNGPDNQEAAVEAPLVRAASPTQRQSLLRRIGTWLGF
jgi:hypothetical protein